MKGKGSLFVLLTSFLLYVFDVGSDIYVAITYYQKEDLWWFGITIALVILPSFIVNAIALGANLKISKKGRIFKLVVNVFQLSVSQQYWEALKRWKRMNWDKGAPQPCNKDNYDKKCAKYDFDLATTRYIEAFAESTPQWCLQFYIMLRQWSFPWITITSTVFSLLSLLWSITALEKTAKIEVNPTMTFPKRSLIAFSLWQLGILVSRLSAIVIFAYTFRIYVFIVIVTHCTVVSVVIMINQYLNENRDHCKKTAMIISFGSYPLLFHLSSTTNILMFNYFNNKKNKILNVIACGIFFLENATMVSLSVWYEPRSTPHIEFLQKIVLPLVFAGFAIGLLFCGFYYNFFHPSKMKMDKVLYQLKSQHNFKAENNSYENQIATTLNTVS